MTPSATCSDKALLEYARNGSDAAAATLLARWRISVDPEAVLFKWKRSGGMLSVSAAKRIALSMSMVAQ